MNVRLNSYYLLIRLMSIFTIGIFLYEKVNPIFPLNKVIGMGILSIVLYQCIKKNFAVRSDALIIIMAITIAMYTILLASDKSLGFIDSIYWLCTIMMVLLFSRKRELDLFCAEIEKAYKFLRGICIFNNLILMICLLSPLCYNDNWGGHYFVGFSPSNHVLACGCCLVLVISLFVTKKIKSNIISFLYLIVPTYGVLQSGSRIYLASVLIIWFVFYVCCLQNKSLKKLMLPVVFIVGIFCFFNSGIYKKMINPSSYGDLVGIARITNGRSEFWMIDLTQYLKGSIIKMIFGGGFDYTSMLNKKYYNMYIWAHNDFIEVLLCAGIIGIFIYILVFSRIFRLMKKHLDNVQLYIVFSYFLLIALINGFFGYQHYLYSFILLYTFVVMHSDQVSKAGKWNGKRIGKRHCTCLQCH